LGVPQTGNHRARDRRRRFANAPAEIAAANLFNIQRDFSDDKNPGSSR